MTDIIHYLDQSQRQLTRIITILLLGGMLFVVLLAFVFFLFQPSTVILLYAGVIFLSGCIGLLTLVWLPKRPIEQAIAPVIFAFMAATAISGLFVDALRFLAACGMSLAILGSGIAGKPRFTLQVAIAGLAIALIMMLPLPLPDISAELGPLLPTLMIVSPALLIILIWAVLDRILRLQMAAVQLANTRAREAEQARDSAEAARREIEQRSTEQQRLLELVHTLELPILNIGKGIVAVPLIGHLDSRRMERIQANVLSAVSREHAHTVIFDITGVAMMDTGVAQNLIRTGQAVQLLGARARLTGISPIIAQTLVMLGVNLDTLETFSDLHTAISQ